MLFFRKKKALPEPVIETIECGLCEDRIEIDGLVDHWCQRHTHIAGENQSDEVPYRDGSVPRTMVLVIQRPSYDTSFQARFNEERVNIMFFTQAILRLAKTYPQYRFQYLPLHTGDSGQYLKTALVIAELAR